MDDDDFAELFRKLPSRPSSGASWKDVASEFEGLTRTVGDILREAWNRTGEDPALGRLRDSLQSMIGDLNRAVDGTPEALQAREQLVQLTESMRATAERASDELRPELVSMLRQANRELRRFTRVDEPD